MALPKAEPCPFCGWQIDFGAEIYWQEELRFSNPPNPPECIRCMCGAKTNYHVRREDAMKQWNTRPGEAKLAARVAELENQLSPKPWSVIPTVSRTPCDRPNYANIPRREKED